MSEFNLIYEPWILVRTQDCEVKPINLKEAFVNAHEYTGLAGETKTQDFAVLRLLLAVMHTVFSRYDLQGNEIDIQNEGVDYPVDTWENIWRLKHIPEKPIHKYFEKWENRFWLFDDEFPFYQSNAVKEKGSIISTSKIIGTLFESANKTRLFTDRLDEGRTLSFGEAARWLLHINNFDDIAAKKPVPKRAWASKLGLIAIKGNNLFETIMLNYVAETDGADAVNVPSWENKPSDEFNNFIAIPNNQAELLSLQSRRIYLNKEGDRVSGYYISGGDCFDEEDVFIENMTIWRKDLKDKTTNTKLKPKLHNGDTRSWQEFGAIADAGEENENDSSKGQRMPGVIAWIKKLQEYEILERDFILNISTASVIYNYKQSTSLPVIDLISDSLTLHLQLLQDVGRGWRKRINDEIEKCQNAGKATKTLSVSLQKSGGASGEKITGETAEKQFFSRIDRIFRLWLAKLTVEEDEGYISELERQLKKTALKLGDELTERTNRGGILGRVSESGERYSASEALNFYIYRIGKIFDRAGDDK